MRTFLFFVFLVFNFKAVFGQFAKVIDNDGYVNLRKESNASSKIVSKIKSDEIVFISHKGNESKNWSYVSYDLKEGNVFSKSVEGFIHNSRLETIDSYLLIPSTESNSTEADFICCDVNIAIKSEELNYTTENKNFTKHEGYYTYKGKYAFGLLGNFLPKNHYLSINGTIESKYFEVPKDKIDNFFDVNNDLAECYYDKKNKTVYILLNNSDGSESYNVLLIIKNGKYERSIIYDDY